MAIVRLWIALERFSKLSVRRDDSGPRSGPRARDGYAGARKNFARGTGE